MERGVPDAISAPCARTWTWSASAATACMMCSMRRTVTPPATTSRMRATISLISDGFRPAMTSSRRRRRGSVASARATSRRLRPETVSALAGRSRKGPSPSLVPTARALSSASRALPRRRKAPTRMLWATDSPAKGWVIWKVRTMPRSAIRSGAQPVTSVPSKATVPAFGRMKPATMAKVVVLPAPFGPISAVMAPAGTSKSTLLTAWRPPKRTDRPRTSSTAPPRDAARQEGDDEEKRQPVQHGREAGQRHEGAGRVGHHVERDRAEDRARNRAGAPDHGDEQHLDAALGPEGNDRIDVEVGLRVEHPAERRDGAGDR